MQDKKGKRSICGSHSAAHSLAPASHQTKPRSRGRRSCFNNSHSFFRVFLRWEGRFWFCCDVLPINYCQ
eukprot:scaffold420_cov169-Ochromonas_danica.AAC.23